MASSDRISVYTNEIQLSISDVPNPKFLIEIVITSQDSITKTSNGILTVYLQKPSNIPDSILVNRLTYTGSAGTHNLITPDKYIGVVNNNDIVYQNTITFTHNEDGTKAFNFTVEIDASCTVQGKLIEKTVSVTAHWELPTIKDTGAVITSAPNFTDEQSPKITYNNPLGNNADSVKVCISFTKARADIPYRNVPKTSSSYQFYFSQDELNTIYDYMKDKKTTDVWFFLKTYKDGKTLYTSSLKRTLTIANAEPTLEYSIKDVNPNTLTLTNDERVLINTLSQAQVSVYASSKKGATIEGIKIVNGKNERISTQDLFTTVFEPVETEEFTITVVDSRDNQTTQVVKPYRFTPYFKPQLTVNDLKMDLDGNISFYITGVFYNGILYGDVKNTLAGRYKYKKHTNSTYTTNSYGSNLIVHSNGNFNSNTITISGSSYLELYDFVTEVYDKFSLISTDEYTLNAYPVFDWGEDDFNFNVPVNINGSLTVNGVEIVGNADYIVEQGTKTTGSGNSTANWVYRKWNSGIAECWCRKHVSTAVNTSWGNLYVSGALSYTNITWGVNFTEIPVANITIAPNSTGAFLIAGGSTTLSATNTGGYEIARGSALASAGNFYINYYGIGKWR